MTVLAWSVVQTPILVDIQLRRVVPWEASSQVPLCHLLPWPQPPAERQAGLLRAVSWGSGHWGLALPLSQSPAASSSGSQVFTESSAHGSGPCTHWTRLAGRGGKLTWVTQAQMPRGHADSSWVRRAVGTPRPGQRPLSKGTAPPPQSLLEVSLWKLGLESAWSSIFVKEMGNRDF